VVNIIYVIVFGQAHVVAPLWGTYFYQICPLCPKNLDSIVRLYCSQKTDFSHFLMGINEASKI